MRFDKSHMIESYVQYYAPRLQHLKKKVIGNCQISLYKKTGQVRVGPRAIIGFQSCIIMRTKRTDFCCYMNIKTVSAAHNV